MSRCGSQIVRCCPTQSTRTADAGAKRPAEAVAKLVRGRSARVLADAQDRAPEHPSVPLLAPLRQASATASGPLCRRLKPLNLNQTHDSNT